MLLVVLLPALVVGVLTLSWDWAGFVAIAALVVLGAWWLLQDESEELEGDLSRKGVREGRSFRFRLRD